MQLPPHLAHSLCDRIPEQLAEARGVLLHHLAPNLGVSQERIRFDQQEGEAVLHVVEYACKAVGGLGVGGSGLGFGVWGFGF